MDTNPYAAWPEGDAALLSALYDNNGDPRNQADLKTLQATSAAAHQELAACKTTQRFGAQDWQSFDVFRPAGRPTGALVFVHGGRWQVNTSRETAFWARACVDAGLLFVGLNFPRRSEAALPAQIDAVAQALAAALEFITAQGMTAGQVCLAGHSSGAHLALAALLQRPVDLGALLLLGGMYDLRPLRETSHQEALRLGEHEARDGSPLLALAAGAPVSLPPTLVAVGAEETGEFIRQARALHWQLQRHTRVFWHLVPRAAHFDAALEFNAPQSVLRQFSLHHGL